MRTLPSSLAPAGYSPARLNPLSPAVVNDQGQRLTDLMAIKRLFANGENGGYWPADLAYLYEDSVGTIPASVNGVVGLWYDASRGLELGPELIGNGSFTVATGWGLGTNVTISNGTLNFNTITNNNATYAASLTLGKSYLVTLDLISRTRGTPYIYLSTVLLMIPSPSTMGRKSLIVVSNSATFAIFGGVFNIGGDAVIDNISVKSINSVVAVQSTTGNKPYLRKTPVSNKFWLDSNTATGAMTATFGGSLGSACTIATVGAEGVTITENQTVGTTYNITPPYGYNGDVLIINRALTAAEKALVTRVMGWNVPMLGSNLAVNGAFSADTSWTKGSGWSISGVATKSAGTASNLTQSLGVSGNQYQVTADITRTAGTVGAYNGTAQMGATAATKTAEKYAMKTTSTTIGFQGDASFAGTIDNAVIQDIL